MADELHVATISPEGVLQRTSPSALELFERCETAWWLRYKAHAQERLRRAIILAQQAGTNAHAQLEAYGKGGPEPTDLLARALMKYMPALGPGLLLETHTDPLLEIAGIQVTGRIDWTHGYVPTRPIVSDWKTRSDLDKYEKTEEELRKDIQMNCYALWGWLYYPEAEAIDVAHFYVETKYHKDKDTGAIECQRCEPHNAHCTNPKHAPRTSTTMVTFTPDDSARAMERLIKTVERMKQVAPLLAAKDCGHPKDFISRNSPCNLFGGCGYKYTCVHHPNYQAPAPDLFEQLVGRKETMASGLSDLLAARRSAAATPAPAPATPPKPALDPKTQCEVCGSPNGYAHAKTCTKATPAMASNGPAPRNIAAVDGYVMDVATRRGLADAVVSLVGTNAAVVTNDKGYYKMEGLPLGAVITLHAEKEGFKPANIGVGPLIAPDIMRGFFDMEVDQVTKPVEVGERPVPGGIIRPETPYIANPEIIPHLPKQVTATVGAVTPETIAANKAKPAEGSATVDGKHVHSYDANRVCVCGAKQRGRKPNAPAPEQEAEIIERGTIPDVKPPVEIRTGFVADIACDPPTKVQAAGEPIKGAVVNIAQEAQDKLSEGDYKAPEPVVRKSLLINAYAPKGGYTDLSAYVAERAAELAGKALGAGHTDPRFVTDKNNPMGYGGWRGALAEYVKNNPPTGNRWVLWTRGDDLAETVAMALASLPDVEVITGR